MKVSAVILNLAFFAALNFVARPLWSQETGLQKSCLEIIQQYKGFWENDSLGHSGLRLIIGEKYLGKCKLNDLNWNDVLKILGKPARSFSLEDKSRIYHRYILFRQIDNEWSTTGNVYFVVEVVNNIIVNSGLEYND